MSRQTKILAQAAAALVLLVAVCAVSWFLVGCGPEDLTTVEADRLLRDSEFLRQTSTTKLILYKDDWISIPDFVAQHPDLKPFLDLGLVAVRSARRVWILGLVGAVSYLTPEGERASAGWQRSSGPEGEDAWMVPTASKELVEVQVPVEISDTEAACSFTWKWIPTAMGKAVGTPDTTETSRAKFRLREQTDGEEKWFLEEGSVR